MSKEAKIILIIGGVFAVGILGWVFFHQRSTSSVKAIPDELILGDAIIDTIAPTGIDPNLDAVTRYETTKSKKEIVDFYTEWFNDKGWNISQNRELDPSTHLIVARHPEQGRMQMFVTGLSEDSEHTEIVGRTNNVTIIYGYGR